MNTTTTGWKEASQLRRAFNDLVDGFRAHRVWRRLARMDIRQKYRRSVLGPFTFVAPKEWAEKPITSSMRAAQYTWSEKSGEQAELVVYYFGEGGAGGVEANLERWLGQITQANGKPSKDIAKIEKTKFAGQEATVVSVGGRLTTQQMPGGPAPVDMADAMLLAAIVNSPTGPYYFKATGSKKTVDANNIRFRAMLASMKLK